MKITVKVVDRSDRIDWNEQVTYKYEGNALELMGHMAAVEMFHADCPHYEVQALDIENDGVIYHAENVANAKTYLYVHI